MNSNTNSKKGKRGFKKLITGVIAAAIAVVLCVTMIPQDALAATADLDTSTKYSESLGDNASTEYAGRIWTDKSVYSEATTFEMFGGKTSEQITINTNAGEDFLVAYSALATSQAISGKTQAPIDVVFVIDISGSMSNNESNMDNGYSRIYNTVQAVNASITDLMALNDHTRVGVVAFSNEYQVLLPLDRYTKVNASTNYFSLSKNTAAQYIGQWWDQQLESIYLYTNAKPSQGPNISKETNVSGGTNIQMGLYGGLNMLATETSTYATIEGNQITRIPSLILLSDGSPTYSSSSNSWWVPANNNDDGPGSSAYPGNGMKALMTGAYMKQMVDAHYGVSGTAYATSIYTVGMGITNLPNRENNSYTGEQDLAYITLNPEDYWNANNDMAKDISGAWNTYITNNGKPTLEVKNNDDYTFNHPGSNDIDEDKDALQTLVTDYYAADSATSVTNVFDEIVSNISLSVPSVPTELGGDLPITQDGYITYTDPIGEYMEVKTIKNIIYAGQQFSLPEGYTPSYNEATKTTTYVFTGTVDSAVYGQQNLKDIIINVTEDENGNETLVVKVPASVIPVRVNTVQLKEDGTVESHTNNGAYPIRVVYSVGLKAGLKDATTDVIDTSLLSAEYLANNTNSDGTVNFYSNLYTGREITHIHAEDGSTQTTTVGDATVEFEPAHSNPFYYMQEDVPIYTNKEGTIQATGTLDDNTTYYYIMEYYHGLSVEKEIVARTGKQLKATDIITKNGKLYRAKGSPRLNRIMEFEGTKVKNATNTANDFYLPTFVDGTETADAYDGKYVIYLGNNGVVNYAASGELEISKSVIIPNGLTPSATEFEFEVDFDGNVTTAFIYDIFDAEGNKVSTGTNTIADGGIIKLANGQKAVINGLPHGMGYTVTESGANTNGFTTDVTAAAGNEDTVLVSANKEYGAEGTIEAGVVDTVAFKNTYDVTSVKYPTESGISGTKVLTGRDWMDGESYSFTLHAYNGAPLPAGATEDKLTVTVGKTNVASDTVVNRDTATFNFGSITFTEPGTYEYTVYENEPTNSNPGMTYSRALYMIVVKVEDNGQGALIIESSNVQKLYTDPADIAEGATYTAERLFTYDAQNNIVMNEGQEAQDDIVFTNVYQAGPISRTPVATKDYTDTTGAKPFTSGMFEFKFEPVGTYNGDALLTTPEAIAKVPMPTDVSGNKLAFVIEKNEDYNITFPSVTFKQSDIPENATAASYMYKISEVLPEGATSENNYTVNGMKYDATQYFVKVTISNNGTEFLTFASEYYTGSVDNLVKADTNVARFANTYDPVDTAVTLTGTKILDGRDWLDSDQFTFNLAATNAAAKALLNANAPVPTTDIVENVVEEEDTTFVFGEFTVEQPGTYTFTIDEAGTGTVNGITYDTHVTDVTVVVTDTNGVLSATVTYDNKGVSADTDKAVFVNTYAYEETTPISLIGTKNLTGRPIEAGEFFFIVDPEGNAPRYAAIPVPGDNTIADGKYTSTATLLDNVVFTKPGTYTYYIGEQVPTGGVLNGVTYDQTLYRYTVEVKDNNAGKLVVDSKKLERKLVTDTEWTVLGANDIVVFNNSYDAVDATHAAPVVTKAISGRDWMTTDEFTFTLEANPAHQDTEAAVNAGTVVLPSTSAKASSLTSGNAVFGNITFKEPGVYQFKITEQAGNIAGMNYSNNELIVEYTVTDNLDGNLVAEMTGRTGRYTFTNTYSAKGEFDLTISKTLAGRTWLPTDAFEFEVVVLDPDTQTAIDNKDIVFPTESESDDIIKLTIEDDTLNHTVTSPKIIVNKAGTYQFVVREVTGTTAGMHYDSEPRTVTVVAVDNLNGTITTTPTVTDKENRGLNFVNTYDDKSVELSGHDNLWVKKTFTGRADNRWFDTDVFKFKLEAVNPNVLVAEEGKAPAVVLPTETILEITNKNVAHAHFGNILFNEAGTYEFRISEISVGTNNGITYDITPVVVKVKVVSNPTLGTLEASVESITKGNDTPTAIEFVNSYSVKEKAAAFEVSKNLVGREWSGTDEFTFELTPADATTENAIKDGNVTPSATTTVVTKSTDGKGSFSINFKKAGTYKFHVNEVEGLDDNLTYDTHEAHVTITVRDDGNGNLETAVATAVEGGLTFTNTFTPDPIDVPISGKKELDGRTLNAREFHFRIAAITENAPMPAVHDYTVANDADGNINFGTIRYTKEGTYQYRISEIMTPIAGVTYDTVDVIATVQVNKTLDGILVPSVTYAKENGTGTEFVFNNTYTTTPTDPVKISAYKEVSPTEGNSFAMAGADFSFEIEPAASNPDSANPVIPQQIVTNTADGTVLFKDAVYSEPGTYVYTIHETSSNRGGITLDTSVYTVTVIVADDASVAQLQADVTITNAAGDEVSAMTFDNGYNPTETSVIFHGHKKLLGGHRDLEAGEFEFQLKDATGAVIDTVTNTETGLFQFDAITYTAPTEVDAPHVYTITEVAGNEAGMAYDGATYTVKVTVVDDNGVLKATVEGITNADGTPIVVFENTYIPGAEFVSNIGGNKELTGREMAEGEFEFTLLDENAKEVAIAKNTAEGTFAFENVKFEKAGTYNFTIVEKDTDVLGITYDLDTTYGVEVEIKDIGGQLDTESITYYKNGVAITSEEVTFTNTYKAVNPATVQLGAAKTLSGRELKAGEFTFLLTGTDGTALTAVNGADGSVLFDAIQFTEAGTYTYVITEAKGNAENVTYDGSKFTITVVVTDDLKGNLVAEITSITESVAGREVAANAVTFENTYTAPDPGTSPKTNDIFNLWMLLAVICVAGFGLFGATVYSRRY